MARWSVSIWLLSVAIGGFVDPARALLIDLDQVSQPRRTEAGAVSVNICTFAPGEAPGIACSLFAESGAIGYASAQQPLADFLVLPTSAPSLHDLWADGHRVLSEPAVLFVTGLAAGDYSVTLMSHNPSGTDLDTTLFEVNGAGPFEIRNQRLPDDFIALQTLTLPVTVDGNGRIEIRFWSGTEGSYGQLNGVRIVPETSTAALLGLGLAAAASRGRSR